MIPRLFLVPALVLSALPLHAQDKKETPPVVNIIEDLAAAAPVWISAFDEASKSQVAVVVVLQIEIPAPPKPHKRHCPQINR